MIVGPPASGGAKGRTSRIERTAKELLLVAPASRARVEFHGPTMEPLLRDGDLLTLCAVSLGELRRGDIVALRVSDKFPTCRVARVIGDSVVLSADNWPDFHATAPSQDIIGKVVRRTRAGRDLSREDWTWRAHAVLALIREAFRSVTPLVRRKRARFALFPSR
jgi:hypothetical protein